MIIYDPILDLLLKFSHHQKSVNKFSLKHGTTFYKNIFLINMKYKEINKQNFEEIVIAQQQPTILIFGAKWSGNSEIMSNMMERVSTEFEPDIKFFNIDIEDQSDIAQFFGVYNIPTTIIIKEGEVIDFIKGFVSAHKIRSKVKTNFLSGKV